MVQHREDGGNLARVAGDADPGVVVVGKDVVNDDPAAGDLVGCGLALVQVAAPQEVRLGEALLKLEVGGIGVDLRLGGAAVAGVDADALAEELLDGGLEGARARQVQAGKGDVGSLQASLEGRAVVGLEVRQLLLLEARLVVGVGLVCLDKAVGGQLRIRPDGSAVAILLAPVAL